MPVLATRTAKTMRHGPDEPIEALILGTGWPNIYLSLLSLLVVYCRFLRANVP